LKTFRASTAPTYCFPVGMTARYLSTRKIDDVVE
jgi:hypothetical protein